MWMGVHINHLTWDCAIYSETTATKMINIIYIIYYITYKCLPLLQGISIRSHNPAIKTRGKRAEKGFPVVTLSSNSEKEVAELMACNEKVIKRLFFHAFQSIPSLCVCISLYVLYVCLYPFFYSLHTYKMFSDLCVSAHDA